MKRDHRVLWHKKLRIFCFQRQIHVLAKQKSRVGHSISHLHKVLDGHVGNCISVDLSRLFEFLKNKLPVCPVPVEEFQKARAILKTAIDSLSKERNNRMRRVPQQKTPTID